MQNYLSETLNAIAQNYYSALKLKSEKCALSQTAVKVLGNQSFRRNKLNPLLDIHAFCVQASKLDERAFSSSLFTHITDANSLSAIIDRIEAEGKVNHACIARIVYLSFEPKDLADLKATLLSINEIDPHVAASLALWAYRATAFPPSTSIPEIISSLLAVRDYESISILRQFCDFVKNIPLPQARQLALNYYLNKKFSESLFWSTHVVSKRKNELGTHQLRVAAKTHLCDWTNAQEDERIKRRTLASGDTISPLLALSWIDDPRLQLKSAKRKAAVSQRLRSRPLQQSDRITIAYVSSDIREHPMARLLAPLLSHHDSSKFDILLFSTGPSDDSKIAKSVKNSVDKFFDVSLCDTPQMIKLMRAQNIDVCIDLNGLSRGARPELFDHGVAPVQAQFLGYPGTTGSKSIDYIIADEIVIPESERRHYCENVVYLPGTYYPPQMKPSAVTATPTTKKRFPKDSFVFCCFNNSYKISNVEFEIWARCLRKIDNSVLWLLSSNTHMEENLRNKFVELGGDPERLIFAPRGNHNEYMAHYLHADVFLDTFNYNAHTTASDALMMGVPVVTKKGRQFSARVAASILYAAGLPELVTTTATEYEELILSLAKSEDQLREVKKRVIASHKESKFLNAESYTKGFEAAVEAMHRANGSNLRPEDIHIQLD